MLPVKGRRYSLPRQYQRLLSLLLMKYNLPTHSDGKPNSIVVTSETCDFLLPSLPRAIRFIAVPLPFPRLDLAHRPRLSMWCAHTPPIGPGYTSQHGRRSIPMNNTMLHVFQKIIAGINQTVAGALFFYLFQIPKGGHETAHPPCPLHNADVKWQHCFS